MKIMTEKVDEQFKEQSTKVETEKESEERYEEDSIHCVPHARQTLWKRVIWKLAEISINRRVYSNATHNDGISGTLV